MRSVLFSIPLDARLNFGPLGDLPVFGAGLLLSVWCLLGLAFAAILWRKGAWKHSGTASSVVVWAVVAFAIYQLPRLPVKAIPIYGYGTMLFVGFVSAASFAAWRLRREGADGDLSWDVAMWLFVSGIIGARSFFIITHPQRFFALDPLTSERPPLRKILFSLINLPDGGLVLYGALILSPLAYAIFCRRRKISALAFGDLAISSVFIGLMFGRLGCLMHGCCYGDVCSLPWAISFPQGSVPYDALVSRGLQSLDRPRSLLLHPTQIYDALNAALLALLTYTYYPFRRRAGEVLAMGWMLYPFNRFLIEFLRSDEPPVFGTPLTGAQWVSLGLFAVAAAFFAWLQTRPTSARPISLALPAPAREPAPG